MSCRGKGSSSRDAMEYLREHGRSEESTTNVRRRIENDDVHLR